ncbi:MAG: energy-coupling factor transporter ATPase [Clostridiales bacterium]|nr:energy-coupling factor transporter ATPase [Clostridiales bacterium]
MEAIRFDNVTFRYNQTGDLRPPEEVLTDFGPSDYAVRGISFSIQKGEFVAILGHNGSGKSTVAKLMNGLLFPEKGTITVFGMSTRELEKLFEIRKRVGIVFQNPDNQMIATIVEDDIAFGPENIGIEPDEISRRVDWALRCVGMEGYRMASSFRLSGGQKQRIAIAGVLAIQPQVLVLDESTAMLDPLGRKEVLDVVKSLNKQQGMTVVLITHFMEEASLADRIIVLNDGEKVLEGTPRQVFSRYDYLKSIGLSVPFAAKVARILKDKGVPIEADVLTTEELFERICQLL